MMTRTIKTLIGGTLAAGILGATILMYLIADGSVHGISHERSVLSGNSTQPGADLQVGSDSNGASAAGRPEVVVWKSPTCGCCEDWVTYLEDEGFTVAAHDTDDMDTVKAELGLVDARLKSCHTATVDGYVIEGHVPVSDIEKLLAERPEVVGISAPGMPMMSPGMGSREPKDYDVISFAADGTVEIFSRH